MIEFIKVFLQIFCGVWVVLLGLIIVLRVGVAIFSFVESRRDEDAAFVVGAVYVISLFIFVLSLIVTLDAIQ